MSERRCGSGAACAASSSRVFGDDDLVVEPSTTAADVEGWDSVSNIVVLVALEREFGIRFNTGEMAALANVGQLVALITDRLSDQRPQGEA